MNRQSNGNVLPGLIQNCVVVVLAATENRSDCPLQGMRGVVLHIAHDRLQGDGGLLHRDAGLRRHQVYEVLDRFMYDSLAHFDPFLLVREKACQCRKLKD